MCTRSLDVDPRLRALIDVKTIFQNFYIINYADATPEDCYLYKHLSDDEVEGKSFSAELPKFCFPYGRSGSGVSVNVVNDPGTFALVLTDDKGQRQFGYCRYVKESGTSTTLCFCVLSYLPQVEFFDQVLDVLLDMWDVSLDMVQIFLNELHSRPVPLSGGSVVCTPRGQKCKLQFPDTRTLPSMPQNLNLTTFFNKVKIDMMLSLFASLLLERRIILTSERLSVLTASANALNTLLYPLSWQHIFIPVLPEQLLDYVSAPMPFLVGVHKSLIPRVKRMNLEEVVYCDLDKQTVHTWTNDLALLPPEVVAVLEANIKKPMASIDDNFARIFLDLFLYLFGNYREFITVSKSELSSPALLSSTPTSPNNNPMTSPLSSHNPNSRPVLEMDRNSFLESKPDALQPFLSQLLELQMFHQFIDHRIELLCVPSKGSHRRMNRFVQDSISGQLILPRWWVYDCLFEFEYDECNNRGTDLNAERMAIYKSKVMSTMRKSRARLAPSLSAFSSNMKVSIGNARKKMEEVSQGSLSGNDGDDSPSISPTPTPSRDPRGIIKLNSANAYSPTPVPVGVTVRQYHAGDRPPRRPPSGPPPSRHSPTSHRSVPIQQQQPPTPYVKANTYANVNVNTQGKLIDVSSPSPTRIESADTSMGVDSRHTLPIELRPTSRGGAKGEFDILNSPPQNFKPNQKRDASIPLEDGNLLSRDSSHFSHLSDTKAHHGSAASVATDPFDPFCSWTTEQQSHSNTSPLLLPVRTSHELSINSSNISNKNGDESGGADTGISSMSGLPTMDGDLLGFSTDSSVEDKPPLPSRTGVYQHSNSHSARRADDGANENTNGSSRKNVYVRSSSGTHNNNYYSHNQSNSYHNGLRTGLRNGLLDDHDEALLHSVKGLTIGSVPSDGPQISVRGLISLPPPTIPARPHSKTTTPPIYPPPPAPGRRPHGTPNEFDAFQ